MTGRVRVSGHGAKRRDERGVTANDIGRAILTATTAEKQVDLNGERWKLRGGKDWDDDDLDVVVAFDDDGCICVVTLY